MHYRLLEWQNDWEYERSSPPQSQFYKKIPTPTLKLLSNFADEKHLFHRAGEALKHWYKHILHHYANTCGGPQGERWGAREEGWESGYIKKKRALYGETCVFTFMIFHKTLLLLTLWFHWENSHFCIKGLWRKPNNKILPSSQLKLFHLSCCNILFKVSGESECTKSVQTCTKTQFEILLTFYRKKNSFTSLESYTNLYFQQYAFHSLTMKIKWVGTSNSIMLSRHIHKGRTIL